MEPKKRLNRTIYHLNRARRRKLIEFYGCGDGESIGWRVTVRRPSRRRRASKQEPSNGKE